MLQEFITSALIIDDSESEILRLKEYLEEKDIWVKHYTPSQLDGLNKSKFPFNNRKLIFLDLYLDDKSKLEDNISKIRSYFTKVLSKNFGTYGIVLWTKHTDEFSAFVDRIYKNSDKYTSPLFVIPLEKNKYLQNDDFNGVLEELEEKLESDVASSFFVEWNKAVKKGSDKTISALYDLFETNEKKNKHLESVLFNLACNYTGIPVNITPKDSSEKEKKTIKITLKQINPFLQKDLIKSLMDSLQVEISNNHNDIKDLFSNPDNLKYEASEEKTKVLSKLNSLLLLDFHNLLQNTVLPGNIYEILTDDSLLSINDIFYKKNKKIQKLELNNNDEVKVNKRVVIEVTPPCDFAQNKKQLLSRGVGGIMLDYNNNKVRTYFSGDNFYSYLYPIYIEGFEEPQIIIFDFYKFQTIKEDELKDESKYKIIAKAKDKLFADVLQKLSSHTARLGIAVMHP